MKSPVSLHAVVLFLIALAIVALIVLFARVTLGQRAHNRSRALRWRIRLHLRPGAGFASATELSVRWSRWRAVLAGRRARPCLALWARLLLPVTECAVRLGRAQLGRRVFASLEQQCLLLAPPRSGKSGHLADRIIDHPGPALVTTTRGDLFSLTAGLRSLRGLIAVFNPLGVAGIMSTFAWSLIEGCEDPATAARRAGALTGIRSAGASDGNMAFWQGKAAAALAAYLHAAALGGRSIVDVFGWCNLKHQQDAEDILASDPRASKAMLYALGEVTAAGGGNNPANSIRVTMTRALAWVAIPAIEAAVTPVPEQGFDIEAFLRSRGTLYMIAQSAEESSPLAPLFRAFAEELHFVAGLMGTRLRGGKLDPPLGMFLDEVTTVCPVPLADWFSDSAGKGIIIVAVCHGLGQLEARFGRERAQAVWETAGLKMLLGGCGDVQTLDQVSRLCGEIEIAKPDATGETERVRVLPPEVLRALPDKRALVLQFNLSPLVVKLRMGWTRRDVKRARRRGLAFPLIPAESLSPWPPAGQPPVPPETVSPWPPAGPFAPVPPGDGSGGTGQPGNGNGNGSHG